MATFPKIAFWANSHQQACNRRPFTTSRANQAGRACCHRNYWPLPKAPSPRPQMCPVNQATTAASASRTSDAAHHPVSCTAMDLRKLPPLPPCFPAIRPEPRCHCSHAGAIPSCSSPSAHAAQNGGWDGRSLPRQNQEATACHLSLPPSKGSKGRSRPCDSIGPASRAVGFWVWPVLKYFSFCWLQWKQNEADAEILWTSSSHA